MESYKIKRKNALPLSSAIKEYLREEHLTTGLNTRLVFKAWDDVSGAASFTIKRLAARKDFLVEMINARLGRDDLFEQNDKNANWVEELILK